MLIYSCFSVVFLGFIPSAFGFIILLIENGLKSFAANTSKCDNLTFTTVYTYFQAIIETIFALGTVILFTLIVYLIPKKTTHLENSVQKAKAKRDAEIAQHIYLAILLNSIGLAVPVLFNFVVIIKGKDQAPIWIEMIDLAWICATVTSGSTILIYVWKLKVVRKAIMQNVLRCWRATGASNSAVSPGLVIPYIIT